MTKKISNATLHRYPIYLKALRKIKKDGKDKIMSNELAKYVNIKSTTIRRDFSLIGTLGKQGYGYNVNDLIDIFSKELGGEYNEKIILIGCGNFGKTILNYNHWSDVVGEIVCAFDKYPENVTNVSVPVYDIKDLKTYLPEGCKIAILAVSGDVQNTVDLLTSVGIKGILDMTHQHFIVPEGVIVKEIDIVSKIQELVFTTNKLDK
ncbi:MAG: redox-sensing transcriptional repressor Rex [Erysipelotrichaceae bacterium]